MNYELIFSVSGLVAMLGWVVLAVSPIIPRWSDYIAGIAVPVLLSVLYAFIAWQPTQGGGYESFAAVSALFDNPSALLAGWVHFLAFDLVIGAWICRQSRAEGVPHLIVLPLLALTFLFGPIGFLAFSIVRLTQTAFAKALAA